MIFYPVTAQGLTTDPLRPTSTTINLGDAGDCIKPLSSSEPT